ncbi:hypothetical protein [Henriciella aquimarina]|uniref:hypothetical protein n=1 Tax=Henriciella aquimarina TaxID=545261 RepID=UPI0009FF1B22|nr:hypothetical protein [Henriciella aquimarina]
MPRLKTLLACAGLSSLTRRAAMPKADLTIEPIRRSYENDKGDATDSWLFEADSERRAHAGALNSLSSSLERLRKTLSGLAEHAPITVEREPVMPLGAMSFDSDLFDGEPMPVLAGEQPVEDMDTFLFEEADSAIFFGAGTKTDVIYRHAA